MSDFKHPNMTTTFAAAALAVAVLSVIVIGGKLDGVAAAVVTGVVIGVLAGVPASVVGYIFIADTGRTPPSHVLEAIDMLRLEVSASRLLSDEENAELQESLETVSDWLDTVA